MAIFSLLLWLITTLNIFRIAILKRQASEMVGWLIFQFIAIFLQIYFEQMMWQLTLIYLMPVIYFAYYKLIRKSSRFLMVAFYVLTCLLIVAFPIPILDEPSGPYLVGTDTVYIMDESRDREIPTQFWYPSLNTGKASPEVWLTEEMIDGFEKHFKLPPFLFNQIRKVRTNSYPKIEMADGEFPIIIISHGWASFRKVHINLAELLASHGYVVIGLDHPNASVMTKLYDGSVALCDRNLLRDEYIVEDGKKVIDTFTVDIETVIERLPDINKFSLFKNHFDLDNIGVIGHSTGAGAMVQYAMNNQVNALVGLDPWVEPLKNITPLDTEQLYFRSEDWANGTNNDNLSILTNEVYQVKGTSHQDFTMAHVFSPVLKWFGYSSGKGRDVQEALILDFFDKHLKHKLRTLDDEYLTNVWSKN